MAITLMMLGVLLVSIGSLLWIALHNTRQTARQLATDLLEKQTGAVADKLTSHLGAGERLIRFMHAAVITEPDQIEDWRRAGDQLLPLAEMFPQFGWIYYARQSDGMLVGMNRVAGRPVMHVSRYDARGTRHVEEYVKEGGVWTTYQRTGFMPASPDYDPRTRPWYVEAEQGSGRVWTRPYRFFESDLWAVTVAWADRDEIGAVRGVYAVDVLLEDLSSYLRGLRIGRRGMTAILYPDGEILAHSEEESGRSRVEAWAARTSSPLARNDVTMDFHERGVWYFARSTSLHSEGMSDVKLWVLVPALDYLAIARKNAWWTAGIGVLLATGAVILSIIFARRISEPLARVSEDMARISHYDIRSEPYGFSNIHEMAVVTGSLEKMKASLRAFGRYVPGELVRAVLDSGQEARVGGRLERLTVLFSDLAGFTTLSEELSPHQVFEELAESLEILTLAPEREGGAMLTFLGDGVMAVFNAPQALVDHEAAACRAAWKIRMDMEVSNQSRLERGKCPLRVRIGLHTGQVLVGNVGIRERFTYSVLGDAVNFASRLEGLNKLYGTVILAGEETHRAAGAFWFWRRVDRITVMGRSQAEWVYELLGPAEAVNLEIRQATKLYAEGWEAYLLRNFDLAERLFNDAQKARPEDLAAPWMIQRCRDLRAHPPAEHWDGSSQAPVK